MEATGSRHSPVAQAFVDALRGNVCIIGQDGAVVSVSRGWQSAAAEPPASPGSFGECLDYRRFCERAMGRDPAVDPVLEAIRLTLEGKPDEREHEYAIDATAGRRWFLTRVSPAEFAGERFAVVSHEDVTARREAEQSASRASQDYEDFVQCIDGVVWELTLDTFDFTFVSEKSIAILGYRPEEWYEHGFWQSKLHSDDREWAMAFCATATAQRRNHDFIYRMIAADGRVVWLHDVVSVIVENDVAVTLRGVMFDVTREKEAERLRDETEQSYKRLVDLSPWPIAVHQHGRVVFCNAAMTRAFGAESDSAIAGQPVARFVQSTDLEVLAERAMQLATTEAAIASREYDFVRLDGSTFPGEIFVGPATHLGEPAVQVLIQDLTEHRRAEHAIRASEQRLREMLENIDLIAVALDREGSITFCNETFLNLTGWSHAEALGLDWFASVLPPPISEEIRAVHRNIVEHGEPILHLENEILTRAGDRRSVRWSNTILRDASGAITGVASIGEDITDERRALQALTESAEQYRTILDSTTDGFWVTDVDGQLIDANEIYCRMSGYSRQEVLSMSIGDFEAKETRAQVVAHRARIAEQGCDRFETQHRRKDGSVYDVEVSTSFLPRGEYVVFLRDITARKRAEEELHRSEDRLRTIIDNAPYGAHIWELDGSSQLVFTGANAAADRILGLKNASLFGQSIEEAFPHLPARVIDAYRDVAEGGEPWEDEQVAYSEGRISGVFEVHATQVAPRRLAVFFRDITERKRSEAIRDALYEIASTSASCDRLEELYSTIHRILQRLLPAKNFCVALLGESGSIHFDYFVDEHDPKPEVVDVDKSLIGYSLHAGIPLHLPVESFEALRREGKVDLLGMQNVDWISAPLTLGSDVFGLLIVQSYDPSTRFSQADLDLLAFVAQNVGSAISRTRALLAARDAQEIQRALVHGNPDASLLMECDGTVLTANEAFLTRNRYSSLADAVGRNAFDVLPSEVARSRRIRLDEAISTGRVVTFKDVREERDYSVSFCPVFDSAGAVARVAVFSRDITDSQRAERSIQESEERFRASFEQAAVGMVHTSIDGRFLRVNDRFCEIVGYSREELLGWTFANITYPEDLAPDLSRLNRLVHREIDTFTMEKRYIHKNGQIVWVNLTVSRLQLDPNDPPKILGVVEDITARRDVERGMHIRDAAIESSKTAMFLSDLDGVLTYANSAFLETWRYTAEQATGRLSFELWEVPDKAANVSRTVLETGAWSGELRACRADGTLFDADVLLSLVFDAQGKPICVMGITADVTERRCADRELRRFRQALDGSADSIFVIDRRNMKFVDVNRTAESATGYSRPELLQMGPFDLFPTATHEAVARDLDRVLGEHDGIRVETSHRRADGSQFPVEIVLKSVESDDPLVIASARDISERYRAAQTLREREAIFEAMFLTNNAVKLLVDPSDRTIVDANPAAADFYGYPIDALRGMPVAVIDTCLASTPRAQTFDAEARNRSDFEFRHRLASGEVRDVEVYSGPVEMSGRELLFSIVHDVTERHRSESRLRQLAVALENAPDAICITDVHGTITDHNRALETTTGYSSHEIVGSNPRLFKSGQHEPAFYRRMWEVITAGRVWSGQVVNRRKDQTLYHERKTIAPIHDPSGALVGFVSVGRDVSEEIALEARLRESQKMEAIGQLAGGIAHDFNNLLQGIFSYLDLASLQIHDVAPEAMSDIDEVRRSAGRAATLTKQLLAFSRRQVLALHSIQMNDLVAGFLRMIHRVIRENIELHFEPGSSSTLVQADPSQLEQVLLNLCLNARDAMPDRGRIDIAVFTEDIPADSPRLASDTLSGRYVALRVRDTGVGMDEWTLRRIFEPFFTTKGPGHGSGLGLAMVYGIVRQHRGFIEVESKPRQGSTFTVFLPESTAEASEPIGDRREVALKGSSELILFAEDSELIRNAVERVLTSNGYRVLTVADGAEAVATFEANRTEIHLVLLDVVMPRLGGHAACRRIRDVDPDVPVLFCSGYDPDTEQTRFIVEGGFELLQKPFNNVALLRHIRKTLDARRESK